MNDFDDTTQRAPAATTPGAAPHSVHEPPPGAPLMNLVRWILFAFLLLLAGVSITTYALSKRPAPATKQTASKIIYQCPMHPSYTSDKPGECPICGMTLEPVTVGGEHPGTSVGAQQGDVPGLTSVTISSERIQMIGVRTALVERSSLGGELELVGGSGGFRSESPAGSGSSMPTRPGSRCGRGSPCSPYTVPSCSRPSRST